MTQQADTEPTSELKPDQLVWTIDFDEHSHRSGIVEHRVAMITGDRIGLVNRQRHEGWWYDRKLIFTDLADAQAELERRRRLRITTPPENTTTSAFGLTTTPPPPGSTITRLGFPCLTNPVFGQEVWRVELVNYGDKPAEFAAVCYMVGTHRDNKIQLLRRPGDHDNAIFCDRSEIFTEVEQALLEAHQRNRSHQPPIPPPPPASAATVENITKASQTAGLLVDDLRQALKTADAVTALMLLDLIETAARLANKIQALADAGCSE